jgi:hypothetical protein
MSFNFSAPTLEVPNNTNNSNNQFVFGSGDWVDAFFVYEGSDWEDDTNFVMEKV